MAQHAGATAGSSSRCRYIFVLYLLNFGFIVETHIAYGRIRVISIGEKSVGYHCQRCLLTFQPERPQEGGEGDIQNGIHANPA